MSIIKRFLIDRYGRYITDDLLLFVFVIKMARFELSISGFGSIFFMDVIYTIFFILLNHKITALIFNY